MKPVLLGTAQWGLDYGITNALGPVTDERLAEIAASATRWGIDFLDTSPTYGNAETRISQLGRRFRVQTKYLAGDTGVGGAARSLRASSQECGDDPVRLLVHDWSALTPAVRDRAARELEALRSEGSVAAVGVSVYTESDIESAMIAFNHIDVIQLPASILDQRLSASPTLEAARAEGTLVQARSIFLQGVAITEESTFTEHPEAARLRQTAADLDVSLLDFALGFVLAQEWIDEITFGVVNADELEAIMRSLDSSKLQFDWATVAATDSRLLDPRTW